MTQATHVVQLDVPKYLVLNLNDRRDPRAQARLVRELRTAAAWHKLAQARGIRYERAHCLALLTFPNRSRNRDPHNYTPTLKAIIDGLVSGGPDAPTPWPHGLLPDDNSTHLIGPDLRDDVDRTLPLGIGLRLTLTFTAQEPT